MDTPEHTHELKIGDPNAYCICGYGPATVDEVDDHILAAIDGSDDPKAEPEHREAR